MSETVSRSMNVRVFVKGENKDTGYRVTNRVREAIREYRATAAHCYGVLYAAEMAGAQVEFIEGDCRHS